MKAGNVQFILIVETFCIDLSEYVTAGDQKQNLLHAISIITCWWYPESQMSESQQWRREGWRMRERGWCGGMATLWDGIQSAKTSALLCGALLGDIA